MKTNRKNFVKKIIGSLFLTPLFTNAHAKEDLIPEAKKMRIGVLDAIEKSKSMTLSIVNQMPEEFFSFKYTPEAMSFAEQFRHCAVYTFSQFSGRLNFNNPFEGNRPKVDLNKQETLAITNQMYDTLIQWANEITDQKLMRNIEFAGEEIPTWRFFYAMENHIIHHRGQAVVYLRLKGVKPQGYYGW